MAVYIGQHSVMHISMPADGFLSVQSKSA